MTQNFNFGFDKARLVGVYNKDSCSKLEPLQLPLFIDDSLMMVLQFEDQISKKCSYVERSEPSYKAYYKKYGSLSETELKKACSVQDKDLFLLLPQLIHCVGCRRSVEHLFQQVQQFNHSVYESLSISNSGLLMISPDYILNPKKLYHLFYCVRPKLCDLLDSLINVKKNKRCIFHSLKMQKPTDIPFDSKPSLPKWCSCSIMDIWDGMSRECHEEIVTLDCQDVVETMNNYLKKHRFCNECRSKVQRAFYILTGEVDAKKEPGFCSAIYEGLHCCHVQNSKTDIKSLQHIHVCSERSYIIHLLSQAETELNGSKKERHAKTIDIAQEEVCTCLALHLYQRLHKVWHQKLTFEQTWLTLFYIGIESIRQSFEMFIQEKGGINHVEALCEELENTGKDTKLQKKRIRKKRQKKKKEQKLPGSEKPSISLCTNHVDEDQKKSGTLNTSHVVNSNGKVHLCLLDIFTNNDNCLCSDDTSEDDSSELTKEEILEFERNRSQIDVQRSRLRERIRQDFENFCNIGSSHVTDIN